jgi:hypothetical protein
MDEIGAQRIWLVMGETMNERLALAERRLRARELAQKHKRKGGWRPTGEQCSAPTLKGERCTLWAYPDGLCPTHSLERERAEKRGLDP